MVDSFPLILLISVSKSCDRFSFSAHQVLGRKYRQGAKPGAGRHIERRRHPLSALHQPGSLQGKGGKCGKAPAYAHLQKQQQPPVQVPAGGGGDAADGKGAG